MHTTRFCRYCGRIFIVSNLNHDFCSVICRFKSAISFGPPDVCWPYIKLRNKDGYGKFTYQCKEIKAHRFAWALIHGEIPEGMKILHKCDNPPCCNPNHLFMGTTLDNTRDMISKGRRKTEIGSANNQARLNESSVSEIKRLLDVAPYGSQRRIALAYNISETVISQIKHGTLWSHVSNSS